MAAGLRPDPLGELKRSPRPLAAVKGLAPREGEGEKGRGRKEGMEGKEGRGEGGRGGEKGCEEGERRERRGREGVHNLRKTTPRHQMAGYGPDPGHASFSKNI